jgi:hypothetical protein
MILYQSCAVVSVADNTAALPTALEAMLTTKIASVKAKMTLK